MSKHRLRGAMRGICYYLFIDTIDGIIWLAECDIRGFKFRCIECANHNYI